MKDLRIEEDFKPDPDRLLLSIKREESKGHRGKLKVFLGMVAGVGKTFAMLRSARTLKGNGIDIIIGFVETHKRKDTEEQLFGLEIMPRQVLFYKGKQLEEFDIDLALKRKPQIIIVDELAHTNAPESRNKKRHLDIIELLKAGIDVYTAVNVQHIESRSHTVKDIIGVDIRETVPDSFLDLADEIIVIDIPPADLLKRLKEGLIYSTERAQAAEVNFFKVGNLTALRELALRAAAERVDKDLRDYKQIHGISDTWKSSPRLLVAIFASPYAENLIRPARQLADALNASWIGAYINNGKPLTELEKSFLVKNFSLVQELGGEVITSQDEDPVRGLMRVAKQNNVTQIIIGKSQRPWWQTILSGGPLISRLMRISGDIDIYSISNIDRKIKKKKKLFTTPLLLEKNENEYGLLFILVFLSWFLASALVQFLGYLSIGFIFLLVVCLSGLYLSRLSTLLLATIFAGIHNFFFIPPIYTFTVERSEDFMMLSMFFISATVIGHLTNRLRTREKNLSYREERTLAAYCLAKELLTAKGLRGVLEVGSSYLERTLAMRVLILCSQDSEDEYAGSWIFGYLNVREKAVIDWVLKNGQHAGRFTQTLSASSGYYIPLVGKEKVYGVIGVNTESIANLDVEKISEIDNFSNQIVSAIERELFHEKFKKYSLIESSHRLYRTLLESVSHELKTPLSAIKGCASALLDPIVNKSQSFTKDLANEILIGSSRLQRVVENLLDMSRIDSGLIKSKLVPFSANDLIQSAIRKFRSDFPERLIEFAESNFDAEVLCDPIISEQAIINILHNAHMYSPENKPICINLGKEKEFIKVSIRDFGPGVKSGEEEMIFEKFYRVTPERTGGIGLGLSIVKNFIELQNGKVAVQNHQEGGAVFSLFIPLEKS